MASDGGRVEKPISKPAPPKAPEATTSNVSIGTPAGSGASAFSEERRDAAEKALFRMSGGTQGLPPLANLQAQRGAPVRDAVARMMRKANGAPEAKDRKIPEGGGAALSSEVRTKMEPQLGANLSSVRVHTGGDSERSANSFGARAYTVGSDIHFNSGEFKPGSKEGDKLLAHELTHVVQGQKSGIQRKAKEMDGDEIAAGEEPEVSHPNEPAEVEADSMGEHVADELHRDDESEPEKGDDARPDVKEQKADKAAPQIQAKLSGVARKILLTKKDDSSAPKPATQKAGAAGKSPATGKAEGAKNPAGAQPGAGKDSCPIARSAVDAQVSEHGKELQMDFIGHTLDGTQVSLGMGAVTMDEHGAALGAPHFTLDTTVTYKGKQCAAHIYDSVEKGPGGTLVGKGAKTPFTKLALERFLAFYKRRFGHEPDKLAGLLAWENKLNFQREFYKLMKKTPGITREAAAQAAIRKISFGAHRIAVGYDKFEVTVAVDAPVPLGVDRETGKDLGTQPVPSRIDVIATKGKSK